MGFRSAFPVSYSRESIYTVNPSEDSTADDEEYCCRHKRVRRIIIRIFAVLMLAFLIVAGIMLILYFTFEDFNFLGMSNSSKNHIQHNTIFDDRFEDLSTIDSKLRHHEESTTLKHWTTVKTTTTRIPPRVTTEEDVILLLDSNSEEHQQKITTTTTTTKSPPDPQWNSKDDGDKEDSESSEEEADDSSVPIPVEEFRPVVDVRNNWKPTSPPLHYYTKRYTSPPYRSKEQNTDDNEQDRIPSYDNRPDTTTTVPEPVEEYSEPVLEPITSGTTEHGIVSVITLNNSLVNTTEPNTYETETTEKPYSFFSPLLKFFSTGSNEEEGSSDSSEEEELNPTTTIPLIIVDEIPEEVQAVTTTLPPTTTRITRTTTTTTTTPTPRIVTTTSEAPLEIVMEPVKIRKNNTKKIFSCVEEEFMCVDESRCLTFDLVCDNVEHCKDGSDEQSCTDMVCHPGDFRCVSDGLCVPNDWVCDGTPDCIDGSDEMECSSGPRVEIQAPIARPSTENKNNNNVNSVVEKRLPPTCPQGQLLCLDGECIDIEQVCDGTPDCRDSSDEIYCNLNTD